MQVNVFAPQDANCVEVTVSIFASVAPIVGHVVWHAM